MRYKIIVNYNDRTKRLILSDIENDRFKVLGGEEAENLFNKIIKLVPANLELVNDDPADGRDFSAAVPGTAAETLN